MIIARIEAIKPGTKLGISLGWMYSLKTQTSIPINMEATAPTEDARFQNKPAVRGTKRETRLRDDESPTSS